jgi:hypothetical protein
MKAATSEGSASTIAVVTNKPDERDQGANVTVMCH